jgi:hypothetical protein
MQRCRTCPNCGTYTYMRVARNFRIGTWKQCTSCGTQYAPPTSILVAVAALLLAIPPALLALFAFGSSLELFAIFCAVAAALNAYGVVTIVRYFRTPIGPLEKYRTAGFPVLPPKEER